jgi:bifunctional non-homologous end joining protein LigD
VASVSTKVRGKELALSNVDKVMYSDTGFTKGQVIDCYTNVARYIIPHLKDRPITLEQFPDGVRGEFFYEKDAPSFTPKRVKTFPIPRTSENSMINYILINDLPTLVWSANLIPGRRVRWRYCHGLGHRDVRADRGQLLEG